MLARPLYGRCVHVGVASAVLLITAGCGAVKTAELHGFQDHAVKQKSADACWAACAEMIHSYNGVSMKQEAIVARVRGRPEVEIEAANWYEILQALNPDLAPFDPFEQFWSALGPQFIENPSWLVDIALPREGKDWIDWVDYGAGHLPVRTVDIDELRDGQPLVLAKRPPGSDIGHLVVIFSADYREVPFVDSVNQGIRGILEESSDPEHLKIRRYDVVAVRYIDPADGQVHTEAWEEISGQVDRIVSASAARRQLLGWRELLEKGRQ